MIASHQRARGAASSTQVPYPNVYLYRRIVQSKLFIDQRYAEKIDLDNIADEANFSKFHFIRLFKRAYGQSPHQYLISVRLDRVMTLLANGLPVTQACFDVGFESMSTFSGLFKRRIGITPSQYQANSLRRKELTRTRPLEFVPHCFAAAKGWISENSNFEEVGVI